MSQHISFTDDDLNNQIEIKDNDELLDENGLLKRKGWARQPCLKYNPDKLSKFRKAYRLKEWNYYSIGSSTFYFAVVAIDLGYLCIYQCFFIDFENDKKNSQINSNNTSAMEKSSDYLMDEVLITSLLSKGLCLPSDCDSEGIHTKYETSNFKIEFNTVCKGHDHDTNESSSSPQQQSIKHHIKIYSKKINLVGDLVFDLSPKRESIVLATPIGNDNFYYNRKVNLIPVTGSLKVGGKELLSSTTTASTSSNDDGSGNSNNKSNLDCFGLADIGRGIWDYNSFWLWQSAWGRYGVDNVPIGLNFGAGFGNLATHTENAINVDGVIHKLGHVDIKYNESNLLEPWSFTCKHGRFGDKPLVFTPFKKKFDNNDFKVFVSSFHQILGTFSGEVILDDGERIQIELNGFSEVHKAKW